MKDNYLTEKQLLPILQFTERLLLLIKEYKRSIDLDIQYNSDEKLVRYVLDIDLALGKYQAVLEVFYEENDDQQNDWEDLTKLLNQIEATINA